MGVERLKNTHYSSQTWMLIETLQLMAERNLY